MSAVLENINELPEGWVVSSIGDIAENTQIGIVRSKALQNIEGKGVPYLKMNNVTMGGLVTTDDLVYVDVTDEELEKYTIQEGDILFNTRNSSELVGKTGFANKNVAGCVYNNNLMRIRTKEGIESKYIAYQMVSPAFRKDMEKVKRATTNIAAVYAKDLLPLPVYIAPPEQQKSIVAKIEELFSHIDAGIEALKKAKQLLKQYRQSVLKAAVTGELTKEWREENKVSYESWKESTIGEISVVQTGKTPKRSTEEFWVNGTIPWLTSSATNEAFTHHTEQFVTQIALDSGLKLFEPGTLLLAMYGEGKTRGQVTEITFQATCNQACAAIIVNEEKTSRAFVRLRLYENYEQTRKAASGGNQPNLNLSKVRQITLPLPSLAEQAEIVAQVEQKFSAINRLEKEIKTQLLKVDKNKQSVLASAFSGGLM